MNVCVCSLLPPVGDASRQYFSEEKRRDEEGAEEWGLQKKEKKQKQTGAKTGYLIASVAPSSVGTARRDSPGRQALWTHNNAKLCPVSALHNSLSYFGPQRMSWNFPNCQ